MDFLCPKSKERVKREKIGLFDIGIGLAWKRNKKTPLILIPSTTSTKRNLPGKPMDWRRKKTKRLTYQTEFQLTILNIGLQGEFLEWLPN